MDFDGSDPAAEFLAREQDQLAGIGDDIIPATEQPAAADGAEPVFDPLAGPVTDGDAFLEPSPVDELGTPLHDEFAAEPSMPAAPSPIPREEPEKIRRWREEQRKRLDEKDAEEEVKKQEMRQAAAKELADWYKQHEETVAKTRTANREAEKELVSGENKSTEKAVDWDQIAKLCEFNPKVTRNTKDTSRMRSLILQLKQNPPVKAN